MCVWMVFTVLQDSVAAGDASLLAPTANASQSNRVAFQPSHKVESTTVPPKRAPTTYGTVPDDPRAVYDVTFCSQGTSVAIPPIHF